MTTPRPPGDLSLFYCSFVLAGRTLGPALGYLLGTATLKVFVLPGAQGNLREGDPGWLGAWWLGFIITGCSTLLIAPFLALFPQRLPHTSQRTDAGTLGLVELN